MAGIQIFGKSKCFDTKKAQRFFKERRIPFQYVDINEKGLSKGEFRSVLTSVGGYDALINPKSPSAPLLQYLAYDEDKEDKFSEDPTLYNTPIVRYGKLATVGYKPEVWEKWLLQ